MRGQRTDNDYIATGLVKELSDAYDGIIDYDMVRAVEEAVYVSAPEVFDRSLGRAEVTDITNEGIDFKIRDWDFHISENGIISEVCDGNLIPKAEFLPEFKEALHLGLNLVEMSMEYERRNENVIDRMIDDAKAEINTETIGMDIKGIERNPDFLPSDIII